MSTHAKKPVLILIGMVLITAVIIAAIIVSVTGKKPETGNQSYASASDLGQIYQPSSTKAQSEAPTVSGWNEIDSQWVYCDENGVHLTGKHIIDGEVFRFDENGVSETGRTGSLPKVAVIGDSLAETLGDNDVAGSNYDFYGKVNLHVDTIFTKSVSGSSRTVIDEVRDRDYDIVIIILGENDLTYNGSAWAEMYRDVINGVKERAPGAAVYAQAVFPINESRASANGNPETMSEISAINQIIARVAQEEGITYLDPTAEMVDSDGQLPYDAAADGIHLGVDYSRIWYEWVQKAL